MNVNPEWAAIIRSQEEALRFDGFSNRDALALGLKAVEQAEALGAQVAIRIIAGGAVVFSYKMEGTDLYNDWWMDKKLNTARETGISTLRLCAEVAAGLRERPAFLDEKNNYAIEGGCMPLRRRDGSIFGYMLASGAPHQVDHQVIAGAIARFLDVEIPSVAE